MITLHSLSPIENAATKKDLPAANASVSTALTTIDANQPTCHQLKLQLSDRRPAQKPSKPVTQ